MVELDFSDIPLEFKELLIPIRKKQQELACKIILKNKIKLDAIRFIAGFDVGYNEKGKYACAGVTLLDFRTLEIIEQQVEFFTPPIHYIPSFLHFRESNGYHAVFKKLEEKPDVLIFDGNGIIHPLGIGLASQMGLELNIPSFGVAKTLLLGKYTDKLKIGGYSEIIYNNKTIGVAFQSAEPPIKPIYLSQGHLIDLETVINITREFCYYQKYKTRLPLPLFLTDKLVKEKIAKS